MEMFDCLCAISFCAINPRLDGWGRSVPLLLFFRCLKNERSYRHQTLHILFSSISHILTEGIFRGSDMSAIDDVECSFKNSADLFSLKHAHWTCISTCYLGFLCFGFCLELAERSFFKNVKNVLKFKAIHDKENLSMIMWTKFQDTILKIGWVLPFWMPKSPFLCYLCGFRRFVEFHYLSEFGTSERVPWSFLCRSRKSYLKTCIPPPKHKI